MANGLGARPDQAGRHQQARRGGAGRAALRPGRGGDPVAGLRPGTERRPHRGAMCVLNVPTGGRRPLDPVQAGQDVDDHGLRGDRRRARSRTSTWATSSSTWRTSPTPDWASTSSSGPRWMPSCGIINGWDVVVDNNSALSFMGRLGLTPSPSVTIGLLGLRRRGTAGQQRQPAVRLRGAGHVQGGDEDDPRGPVRLGRGAGPAAGSRRECHLVGRRALVRPDAVRVLRPGAAGRLRGRRERRADVGRAGLCGGGCRGSSAASRRRSTFTSSRRRPSGRSSASTSPAWMTTARSMIPRAPSRPSASAPPTPF